MKCLCGTKPFNLTLFSQFFNLSTTLIVTLIFNVIKLVSVEGGGRGEGGGGASVTREIMQRKDALQFYEISSLCANVLLPSTLLQFSIRKTLQEGLNWG